jgi:membrane protein
MDPAKILARVLDEPRVAYVMSVLDAYGRAAGGMLANGLAFSALFALFPTTLLVLGLAGWLAGDPSVQEEIVEALSAAFPPLADLFEGVTQSVSQAAAVTSIIGVVGIAWTVTSFYGALDVAFARIFAGVPERDIVRRTAVGFLWVAILVGLVIAAIVIGSLATLFDALIPAAMPTATSIARIITSPLALVVIAVIATTLLYRTVPPKAPSWAAIRIPAFVVGVAIVLLSQVFMFLVPRLVGAAALAGSLAAAFIALAWFSFSFQALLYGAAWVRIRNEHERTAPTGSGGDSALGGPTPPAEAGGGGE